MGPRVPFAPSLLTLSLRITLHINFISSRLFILLYVTCVMFNKVFLNKNKKNKIISCPQVKFVCRCTSLLKEDLAVLTGLVSTLIA